jgi:hypothetical protein
MPINTVSWKSAITDIQRLSPAAVSVQLGRMVKVIACIEDPVVIEKILSHLSEKASSTETTLLPESRAPPHAGLYG